MRNLVIQSFGKESELKRAILTILSFYAHAEADIQSTRVLVFTDNPEYFKVYLDGLPATYILLTPEKIKQMRGEIDFLHRMKIAVIEEAFQLTDGNLLYADSDTFFTADPIPLLDSVTPERSYMHLWEYAFGNMPDGQTFQAYRALIESAPLRLTDGSPIQVTTEHSSWNAGVMMLHPRHAAYIPDVYALTEQTYPGTKNHAAEQYAFSIVLQMRTRLAACDSVIYHYWYRVKKQIMDNFLAKNLDSHFAAGSMAGKLQTVKKWTKVLPEDMENDVLMLRDHAVQAFNENKFGEGYKWAGKAILRKPPGDKTFIKDLLYHVKRHLTGKE